MAGIYIHIPFCKQACHYCNFHFSTSIDDKPRMVDAICQEITLKKNIIDEEIQTIYFGGGTPSLLSATDIENIFTAIYSHYQITDQVEVTFETNPDDVSDDFIAILMNSPINRLSMGIQSFHQVDLEYMNRAHTAHEGQLALERCAKAGIDNISADLIYGVPTLSDEAWLENIHIMHEAGVQHTSCYQLTVEEKTPLAAFIERGSRISPSDETAVRQFYMLLDAMARLGYEAYEISNYSKPGFRSKHNSAYWTGAPYIGIGPSAHSFNNGQRLWNTVVNNRYMEEIEAGQIPEASEILSQADQYNEFVLTRLRTIEGIPIKYISTNFQEFRDHFINALSAPIDDKLIQQEEDHIRLTREGKVWADAVSAGLMA